MSWYHVRGVTKEKSEVVELYNKKYARGRYDGPAGHIIFLPVQISKVVAKGYVLVVAGIYCQQLHLKVISSSVGSLSCSLLPIGYNYHHQAALVPMSTSLLSDYAQSLIFQKNLKGGGTAVCAVLLVRVIPHHTFVLPALIGHISTPDVVSGYTT